MTDLVPHPRVHDIVFTRAGRIEILSRVARQLDLAPGDAVNICTDGTEYYLYVSRRAHDIVGRHACICHASHRGSRNFRLNSRHLAARMLALCGNPTKAAFWCGDPLPHTPISCKIPIIYRNNTADR